jgi:RNA polymerase sigma-70 factor (ECF subfamily)
MSARSPGAVADDALIRSVFEEHGRAMLSYAQRLLGDRQAAEDVVQEALVRAWRNPEVLLNGKGSVRGWCLTVIRNLVIDRMRARAARPAEVADADATAAVVGDHAESTVVSITVVDGLGHLSAEHRQVLVELYYRGCSVTEAATRLGIPAGTVRSRCYYALRALRECMGSEGVREAVLR